jgi:hypothetical protein
MIWQDLMVDRWADEAVLRTAAAAAFGVPADTVTVVDDPAQLPGVPPSARVILERDRQHRDFPMQILVILCDDELVGRFDGFGGVLCVAQKLADGVGATVVFAEGPVSPSEWVRVRPSGQVDVVSLDVDESGDVDSYFVVGARELPATWVTGESTAARLTA